MVKSFRFPGSRKAFNVIYYDILILSSDFPVPGSGNYRKSLDVNSKELAAINIEDLIPHQGKMILIDRIIDLTREYAITSSIVNNSWPLATDVGVPSLLMVELAAQCAGVCNGWDRIQTLGTESDKMGWLVGVKRAAFMLDLLPFHGEIITRAENAKKYNGLREIQSVLKLNNKVIGQVALQIFQA